MRLKEIERRLGEIREELNRQDITEERLAELETEVTALQEERTAILNQQERRTNLLNQLATGAAAQEPNGTPTPARVVRTFTGADGASGENGQQAEDIYATMEYRRAFMNYVVRGTRLPQEYRESAVGTTTDVGAVIPTNVLNQIVQKLESTGMILALVTRTAYRGGVSIPVSTVKPTATWVAEGEGSDTQKHTISKEGMITFAYHKLRCAVAVSLEVDTMAMPAFESLLINNIVEAMTKALEQAIVSGSGTGQPKGITKETPAEGQAIDVEEQAYADLIKAEAALPVAYEKGAVWCMSKKTYMGYYGLTDSNGQPIGRINYGLAGKPEYTLLGRPVVVCDYLPSFEKAETTNVFAFLFNFKDYVLNTNYTMGVKTYEDNNTDDTVTKGIMLVDGKVVDKNSLVTLKKLAAA